MLKDSKTWKTSRLSPCSRPRVPRVPGYNTEYAERVGTFEGMVTAGSALINSSGASEIIQNTVDAGLALFGIPDSGGCRP